MTPGPHRTTEHTHRAPRPTPAEIAAAAGRTIPDLIGPDLHVLFSGINPSLYSAATGHHFARPGNRFWPALHRSGFTPRLLHPSQQDELPRAGLGITNVVARATARADELSPAELIAGGEILTALVDRWRPRYLAVLGVTAYRTAFARPKATIGPQPDRIAGVPVWVLPNPSGLNAHFTLERLTAEFARLRRAASSRTPAVLSVMLAVPDAAEAARWYARALGATTLWDVGGVVGLSVGGAPFFLGEPENNGWATPTDAGTRTVRIEVFVEDPDAFIARAVAAGADGSVDEISDHEAPWGIHRQGGFVDPFGHLWLVGDRSPLTASSS